MRIKVLNVHPMSHLRMCLSVREWLYVPICTHTELVYSWTDRASYTYVNSQNVLQLDGVS